MSIPTAHCAGFEGFPFIPFRPLRAKDPPVVINSLQSLAFEGLVRVTSNSFPDFWLQLYGFGFGRWGHCKYGSHVFRRATIHSRQLLTALKATGWSRELLHPRGMAL